MHANTFRRHKTKGIFMAKAKSTTSASRSSRRDAVIAIDPSLNRPSNADEASPETLVPDVVHMQLDESSIDAPGDADERRARVGRRAYELAEQRGFAPGHELEDWLRAESEIGSQPTNLIAAEDQFTG